MASQHCVACVYLHHHGELFLYFFCYFSSLFFLLSTVAFFSMLNHQQRRWEEKAQKCKTRLNTRVVGERASERERERKRKRETKIEIENYIKTFASQRSPSNRAFILTRVSEKSFPGEFFFWNDKKWFCARLRKKNNCDKHPN